MSTIITMITIITIIIIMIITMTIITIITINANAQEPPPCLCFDASAIPWYVGKYRLY